MTETDLEHLVGGVVTRASTTDSGGVVLSLSTDRGHYVLHAEACHCGKPCDMTHIAITKING